MWALLYQVFILVQRRNASFENQVLIMFILFVTVNLGKDVFKVEGRSVRLILFDNIIKFLRI